MRRCLALIVVWIVLLSITPLSLLLTPEECFAADPLEYEYFTTASTGDSYETDSSNWTYQTFTTNNTSISHSVTSIWLYLKRTGNPGTVTASIRYTSNSTPLSCWTYPTGKDITSGTLDGNYFTTSYAWYQFTVAEKCLVANTTYAIVLSAVNGNASNYVQWGWVALGGYSGGNAGHSIDGGSTWVNDCPADCLFQIWGYPCMGIDNAKVFTSYINDGDWLITCLYKNITEPYYSNGSDVSSLFYIQLVDNVTLKAQTKCPAWGFKPANIYLSAAQVQSLQWGYAYTVRIYGDFAGYPYSDYVLQPYDWQGEDMNRLDTWVRSTSTQMETYYGQTLTTYIAGKGLCLNETGGAIFDTCIPTCSSCRPDLFQIRSTTPGYTLRNYGQSYASGFAWQTLLGPKVTSMFSNLGSSMSVSGDTVGALIGFTFYTVVAIFCFPVGSAIAAITIPSLILLAIWYTGLLPLAALGFILAIAAFFLIWQFWALKLG